MTTQSERAWEALIALPPRKYPNVVEAAPSLAACASPNAYYKLGIDMFMTGLIGVTKELTRKKRQKYRSRD